MIYSLRKVQSFLTPMELKSRITPILFLFLLITVPYVSRGDSNELDPEVYEIDYRGPETHSSVNPPHDRSHGKQPLIHGKRVLKPPKSKGLRVTDMGGKAKKTRG
ncbi:hypothetical protein I3843_10G128300 [Carya illinoinensis]|uniref:Uncharacterized protein n=1 Tax=Carya illinoinensis TaxID=32201 RepID=A0A922DXU4_CARIL|nr:hypothetical protein I3842_10G138400 [Carya illinoinensis]KAG7960525.1 hypothetical protein I3843_10G128300 [Carya illinoinensis]